MTIAERDPDRSSGRRPRGVASADHGLSALSVLLVILIFVVQPLVTIEALVGQLFPAILLARLVSVELLHRDDRIAKEEIRA